MNQRQLFFKHVAQTSTAPLALEIVKAEGSLLYDASGKTYIDLIGGISVANTGHRHPDVLAAIRQQLDAYLHVMVYGEFVESPQVRYATALTEQLPETLNAVYFTNSGAEAVEGAMKLAKKLTNRTRILAFDQSYHGSTQGALSILGDEYWRNAFRPLLPDILHETYNDFSSLEAIDEQVACVIAETVQAEAGVKAPSVAWMQALRKKCSENGVLLILDEIQTGFGRTGTLWGFSQYGIVPDILLLGKALGGGMPLGAFIADKQMMDALSVAPVLGHITTFGGHPVSCAAGLASLQVLLKEDWIEGVRKKEKWLTENLVHPQIKAVRSAGLWLALEFENEETCKRVVDACIQAGVLTDWFLFAPNCLRISPPLSIGDDELQKAVTIIRTAVENSSRD